MTAEQQQQVMDGMDMILKATGATPISDLLRQQEGLLSQLPPEQRDEALKVLREKVSEQIGATFKVATDKIMNIRPEDVKHFTPQM